MPRPPLNDELPALENCLRRAAGPALALLAAVACGGALVPDTAAADAGIAAGAADGGEVGPPPDGGGADAGAPADAGSAGDAGSKGDAGSAADAGSIDAGADAGPDDAGPPGCEWAGAAGHCLASAACAAMADHSAEPGGCAAGLSCCIDTPDVGDNPPLPNGWKLMAQAQVTPAMTTWAVAILHDPVAYPMFATATRMFGALEVLARVEWHPPDFQNGAVHRGVTLYVPG